MVKLVDFSKYQVKKTEDLKIQPEEEIVPDKKEIKLRDLKPPETIKKPPESKKPQGQVFFIDWDYLAHNSSFQRGFTEFIKYTFPQYKSINHRASKDVMNRQLKEKTNEITTAVMVYEDIQKISRGSKVAMKEIINQIKKGVKLDKKGTYQYELYTPKN